MHCFKSYSDIIMSVSLFKFRNVTVSQVSVCLSLDINVSVCIAQYVSRHHNFSKSVQVSLCLSLDIIQLISLSKYMSVFLSLDIVMFISVSKYPSVSL